MNDKMKRLFRFLISGGSAAVVEYGVFIVLASLLSFSLIIAQSVSFMVGFVVSFSLNRAWVFKSGKGNVKSQLVKYSTLAFVNLILSNILIAFLVNIIDLSDLLAKFIVMGCVAAWNYVIFSKLIFKNQE